MRQSLAEHGDDIRVEPLANLPTLTDVVVDMRPFYDRFPDEQPLIRVSEVPPAAQRADDRAFVALGGLPRMRALRVGLPGRGPRPASSVQPRWSRLRARLRSRARASARVSSRGSTVRRASGSAPRAWHTSTAAPRGSSRWGRSSTCVARSSSAAMWIRSCSGRSRTSRCRGTPTATPREDAVAGPGDSTSRFPTPARSRWSTSGSSETSPRLTSECSASRNGSPRNPARRRSVIRAAVRRRAQRGQRRPPGRRAGSVRDARRAQHERLRRRAVRRGLHHRSRIRSTLCATTIRSMGSTSPCTTTPSCSPTWRHRAGSPWVRRSAAHVSRTTTRATWRGTTGSRTRRAS